MTERTCVIEGCEKKRHQRRIYCAAHSAAKYRNDPNRPRCSVDRCDRATYGQGLCQYHWSQTPERQESHLRASRAWANRNKASHDANTRRWIAANPEKAREQRRHSMVKWRANNPEAAKAKMSEWIAANPQRWRELQNGYKGRRRARKAGTQTEPVDLTQILARDGMVCHICSDVIESMADLHFDHIVPLSKGGPHTAENIAPSHAQCNMHKGARLTA
jgi:5-methylcytosine-specific restriction endonuclease McrA